MSLDIMESCAIRFIEYRLQQKLPIKTKDAEQYFRERFYWVVHKFKEQYFIGGEKLNTNSVLDKMFSFIKSGVGSLNLSKLHDFKIALACSLIAAANKFDCSIKVSTEFFQDQFLRVIDQRFHRQSESIIEHTDFLSDVLVKAGADQNKSLKIIEAGVILAETYRHYEYSILEFQVKIIGGILEECERLKIRVTAEMLTSDKIRRMCGVR